MTPVEFIAQQTGLSLAAIGKINPGLIKQISIALGFGSAVGGASSVASSLGSKGVGLGAAGPIGFAGGAGYGLGIRRGFEYYFPLVKNGSITVDQALQDMQNAGGSDTGLGFATGETGQGASLPGHIGGVGENLGGGSFPGLRPEAPVLGEFDPDEHLKNRRQEQDQFYDDRAKELSPVKLENLIHKLMLQFKKMYGNLRNYQNYNSANAKASAKRQADAASAALLKLQKEYRLATGKFFPDPGSSAINY